MKRDVRLRNVVIVFDERSAAFGDFGLKAHAVWMAEIAHESEKVWVAKP